MSHPEDDVGFLYSCLHLDAILDASRHGLLAEDVITLLREGKRHLHMHMILNGNKNSVR